MSIKERLKKIEKEIVPRPKHKLWIVNESYKGNEKDDPEGKKRLDKKIQDIRDSKVKNKDGTYYQEGDTFFIIDRIFTDKRPIKVRIDELKKKKAELEAMIKEK